MELTSKQRALYDKLKKIYGSEPLPSFDVLCREFGFKSKNSIWQYFQKFLETGLIKEKFNKFFIPSETGGLVPIPQSISINRIPHFASGVRAGLPTVAEDYCDKNVSFDEMLIKKPYSTFSVTVIGDSMIEAGICEGDIVVVEKGNPPQNGDIVVASVDGDFTLKYYKKKDGKVYLEPANVNYPVIEPKEELLILGIVTGLVRKY